MEVVCFGLTLPLTEYETLSNSVNLYLDWLTVITTPKPGIPAPIRHEPLPYIRKMICHLENLFIPRFEKLIYLFFFNLEVFDFLTVVTKF